MAAHVGRAPCLALMPCVFGVVPCSVPETSHGRYTFNGVQVPERATIGHAEVVEFSCGHGYAVLGNPTLRCWYGEWTVTGTRPECQPGKSLHTSSYS